ncbi:MAG: hypothetical protein RID91_01215 [Azospirillaceae bacterium]
MTTPFDILADARRATAIDTAERDEARRRTIVSRAYYAAYHQMRRIAGSADLDGPRQRSTGIHRSFITFLIRSDDLTLARLGRRLDRLYDARIKADYRLDRPVQPGQELGALKDAERLIEAATAAGGGR